MHTVFPYPPTITVIPQDNSVRAGTYDLDTLNYVVRVNYHAQKHKTLISHVLRYRPAGIQ